MAQQSSDQLALFHRAGVVLAVGAGLIYGSWKLYTSYVQQPATTLRRSNAVHRIRANRNVLSFEEATLDAPFGTLLLRKNNDETMAINLATTRLPSANVFGDIYGHGSEAIRRDAQSLALQLLVNAAAKMVYDNPGGAAVLEYHGFQELAAALRSRSDDDISQAIHAIPRALHLDLLNQQRVQTVVDGFLRGNILMNGNTTGSDNDDRDVADTEEDWDTEKAEPGQGLRGLLYYIAENDAQRKAYEHRGIQCEECGDLPIRGVRWHCLNCPDFDLCSSCEIHTTHPKTHVFAKIKIPVPILSQPTKEVKLWYPGDPRKVHPSLCVQLKKQLCQDYEYEEPQLDAMYDQFTCLANVPWEQDPRKVRAAIDRRAFNKALTSDRWPAGLATNAMYDRMFAFYDTDNNGLIGFTEFVDGMAYLRGPKRFASLRRTVQGYDLDGDGYVNRADFLRILRAKHIIQKQLISDQVDFRESERMQASMDVLRSSQPISSIFTDEEIPPGEARRPRGKELDAFGDLQPLPTTRSVLQDEDPFVQRPPAREQLRGIMSRFEEHMAPQARTARRGNGTQRSQDLGEACLILDPGPDTEAMDPYLQDILWQVEENGFNELLDPLFQAREAEDAEIVKTREERMTWASEIADTIAAGAHSRTTPVAATTAVKQPRDANEPGDSGCTAYRPPQHRPYRSGRRSTGSIGLGHSTDATGPRAQQQADTDAEQDTEPEAATTATNDLLPTDWASLERREAHIAEAPLEDLLQSIGARIRDDGDAVEEPSNDGETSPLKSATTGQDSTSAAHMSRSEHMPSDKLSADDKEFPSQARLLELARLNDLERAMNERGGPGRLRYDEVEHIVVNSGHPELRGTVKSWLEWASF